MFEFCRRLLSTAKTQSHWSQKHGLDTEQLKVIEISSKYISLFVVASLSTIIQFAIASLLHSFGNDPSLFLGVDCVVNLLCLYLQITASSTRYEKCCRGADACCRWVLTWKLTRYDQEIMASRSPADIPEDITADTNVTPEADSYQVHTNA